MPQVGEQPKSYLNRTVDWVFFRYSMPSADFEFKQLLKRVQLAERHRPKITVLTGGTDGPETADRFEKIFGKVAGERTSSARREPGG